MIIKTPNIKSKTRRGNVSGGQGAQDGAGNGGDGEDNSGFVIDPFHAGIRKRAGQGIEKNDGEGNGGDQVPSLSCG